jgi:hypothetical protein
VVELGLGVGVGLGLEVGVGLDVGVGLGLAEGCGVGLIETVGVGVGFSVGRGNAPFKSMPLNRVLNNSCPEQPLINVIKMTKEPTFQCFIISSSSHRPRILNMNHDCSVLVVTQSRASGVDITSDDIKKYKNEKRSVIF